MKLPKKPSKLIRIALKDLSAVEKSKVYKVDMRTWHTPTFKGVNDLQLDKCIVCLAGAVMAKTFKADPSCKYFGLEDEFHGNQAQLEALNELRTADVMDAINTLDLDVSDARMEKAFEIERTHYIPSYTTRKAPEFKKAMRKLANALERIGL